MFLFAAGSSRIESKGNGVVVATDCPGAARAACAKKAVRGRFVTTWANFALSLPTIRYLCMPMSNGLVKRRVFLMQQKRLNGLASALQGPTPDSFTSTSSCRNRDAQRPSQQAVAASEDDIPPPI